MMVEKLIYSLLRLAFVYVFYNAMLRLAGSRLVGMGKQSGDRQFHVGTAFDLVVALMISDMPDDIIFGSVPVAQGVVAVGTMFLLHMLTSVLAFRVRAFGRLIESAPAPVIHAGEKVQKNVDRERVSDMELDEMLREVRIDRRDEVKEAILEPTGALSVRRVRRFLPAEKQDVKPRKRSK